MDSLNRAERRRIKTLPRPLTLLIASGPTTITQYCPLRCKPLRENIAPLVIEGDSIPNLLSMGHRCKVYGYRMIWPEDG